MKSDSEEIKLDDDSLAFLIAEVAAMVESQQSLSKAMIHLDDPLLGRLGRAVRSIRSELDQGKSISEAFGVLSGRHDLAVKAALAMVVQMRSSSIDKTSGKGTSLRISKGCAPIRPTAAPSTKVST